MTLILPIAHKHYDHQFDNISSAISRKHSITLNASGDSAAVNTWCNTNID